MESHKSSDNVAKSTTKATGTISQHNDSIFDEEDGTAFDFGYKTEYKRVFGTIVNVSLGLGISSPVFAILISADYQIYYGGYWGLVWGWLIPNILLIPTVLSVAELASSMPVNGGFYWWTAAMVPKRFSRPLGFIAGWSMVLVQLTTMASVSSATASTLMNAITMLHPDFEAHNYQNVLVSFALIIGWVILLEAGMERIQWIYTTTGESVNPNNGEAADTMRALVILVTSVAYMAGIPGAEARKGLSFAPASDVFGSYGNYSTWGNSVATQLSFLSAIWVQSGWYSPIYVSEGTHEAPKTIPKSIIYSYGATAVLGMICCIVSAFCIPDIATAAADPTGYPLFTVVQTAWGINGAAAFFLVGVAAGVVGGSGLLQTCSSQIAAFARDGGMPFSKALCQVSPRTNFPTGAILLTAFLSCLLLLLALSNQASAIIYSLAVVNWYVNILLANLSFIFACERWIPGYFNFGRWSKLLHMVSACVQLYFIIVEALPYESIVTFDTFSYSLEMTAILIVIICISWFFWGHKAYEGLDLLSLERRQAELIQEMGDGIP